MIEIINKNIETKEVENQKITYTSVDGYIFDTKEDCIKYELALATVLYKYYDEKLVKQKSNEYDLFGSIVGDEECNVDLVSIKTEEDKSKLLSLIEIWYRQQFNKDTAYNRIENATKKIDKAYETGEYLFIRRGYGYCGRDNADICEVFGNNDCFYVYDTCDDIVDKISSILLKKY